MIIGTRPAALATLARPGDGDDDMSTSTAETFARLLAELRALDATNGTNWSRHYKSAERNRLEQFACLPDLETDVARAREIARQRQSREVEVER